MPNRTLAGSTFFASNGNGSPYSPGLDVTTTVSTTPDARLISLAVLPGRMLYATGVRHSIVNGMSFALFAATGSVSAACVGAIDAATRIVRMPGCVQVSCTVPVAVRGVVADSAGTAVVAVVAVTPVPAAVNVTRASIGDDGPPLDTGAESVSGAG